MKSCLSQCETNQLLSCKLRNTPLTDEIANQCASAELWEKPIGVLTYLLARILETKNIEEDEYKAYLELFYELPNHMYMEIQEIDHIFINHMTRTFRQADYSLDDELIRLYSEILDHDYSNSLRY
jgi:hypothetical protein